jgi:hypothetical protein
VESGSGGNGDEVEVMMKMKLMAGLEWGVFDAFIFDSHRVFVSV